MIHQYQISQCSKNDSIVDYGNFTRKYGVAAFNNSGKYMLIEYIITSSFFYLEFSYWQHGVDYFAVIIRVLPFLPRFSIYVSTNLALTNLFSAL